MKEEARRIKRIAERMVILAGSIRIVADVLDSLANSVRDLSEVLDEKVHGPEDDGFATVSEL